MKIFKRISLHEYAISSLQYTINVLLNLNINLENFLILQFGLQRISTDVIKTREELKFLTNYGKTNEFLPLIIFF